MHLWKKTEQDMAYNVKKINPLDRQPRKAVGVSLPFSGAAVFNQTYVTKDAVKSNLVNYFLTNKKERFFNLNFGSDLTSVLFDNVNPSKIEEIKLNILDELELYFPKVQPTKFEIYSEPDTHKFSVYLKYGIKDSNITDEILINIEQ